MAFRFACLLLLQLAPLQEALLSLESLGGLYPDAVCMDGSPSGYYWKAATSDEGASTWVLYLESGGWCVDNASCAERCASDPHRCTSGVWLPDMNETGIFSDTYDGRPASLRTANKAYVAYCTSDAHMGNAAALGYQFRGARVVEAVLSDLVQRRGLGSGQGGRRDLLLFGGGSAGSRGAMIHLDYVPEMLGNASSNVDVHGFLDSPLWLDMEPWNQSFFDGFPSEARQLFGFANVTHLGDACKAAFEESLHWRCILGEYRLQFVATRYLLVAAQYDSFQLYYDTGHGEEWSEAQVLYAAVFANRTAAILRQLVSGARAVFSPACGSHAESMEDIGFFLHQTEGGASINDAILHFLGLAENATTNGTLQWIDACQGLECGSGCHKGEHLCAGGWRSEAIECEVLELSGARRVCPMHAVSGVLAGAVMSALIALL